MAYGAPPWRIEGLERDVLAGDLGADACVVGAGIAGLTTAYFLARAGRTVIVLDDGAIGGGETRRTTAHLSNAIDDRYEHVETWRGEAGSRLAAESHTAAIDRIETLVREESIACGFERLDGYLFAPLEEPAEPIEREHEAAQRAGVHVQWLEQVPGLPFTTGPCLRFPAQGQLQPMRYLAGLAAACERRRVRIFTGTHVTRIEGGARCRIRTGSGRTVSADAVVMATNTPVNNRVTIHTKQAAYRTYAIAASVPRGSVARALYWDTLDPYHYVRLAPAPDRDGRELLIVGGEDHRTGDDPPGNPHARLEAWARQRFPRLEQVLHAWSGQVMETFDGLAFIGRNPNDDPNVFVATGDSGMGMTHGTIAGMLICDLVHGRDNPWADLYDPGRHVLRAMPAAAKESLHVAWRYREWVTPGDVASEADVRPGEGAILRRGVHKIAVHRDATGQLHERSAVCPHLGCIVRWNAGEKTWDCPCHGSRFDRFGTVVNGPANRDLDPATAPSDVKQASSRSHGADTRDA